jgi:hypothetical protein
VFNKKICKFTLDRTFVNLCKGVESHGNRINVSRYGTRNFDFTVSYQLLLSTAVGFILENVGIFVA